MYFNSEEFMWEKFSLLELSAFIYLRENSLNSVGNPEQLGWLARGSHLPIIVGYKKKSLEVLVVYSEIYFYFLFF